MEPVTFRNFCGVASRLLPQKTLHSTGPLTLALGQKSMKVIEELREYIFVVCKGKSVDGELDPSSLVFLGTAFFISKRGDAVTALHVLNNSPLNENEL